MMQQSPGGITEQLMYETPFQVPYACELIAESSADNNQENEQNHEQCETAVVADASDSADISSVAGRSHAEHLLTD